MIPCVMLAAGESIRMGKWKMTLPWNGRTIIEQSAANAQEAGLDVILVAGYRAEELESVIGTSAVVDHSRIKIVNSDNYRKGMFASARAGFSAAGTDCRWCFLSLGDMPLVSPGIYSMLGSYASAGAEWNTAIPQFRGKKGHPVLLDSKALNLALKLTDDDSMREVISAFPSITVPVGEKGILQDVDTPNDYKIYSK